MAIKNEMLSLLEKYGYNFRVITLMHITERVLYLFHMFYMVNMCLNLRDLMKFPFTIYTLQ